MTDQPQGQPLPTTNQTAATVNQELTELLEDTIPAAENAIIAAEPWMATPVLKQIWQAALKYLIDMIAKLAGQGAGFVVLDIQKYNTLTKAADALTAIQAAQKSGDQNALDQANAQADAAADALLHYTGDVKPK